MKKKFLLAIPALMALTSCGFAKIAAEPKVQEFLEDTLAHEEIFGDVEEQPVIRSVRQLNPVAYSNPVVAIQTANEKEGYISIRFVAAIQVKDGDLANTSAVWHRTMYEPDGDVLKAEEPKASTKAYTTINDNGTPLTIEQFNNSVTNYTHFVVYTMRNIPISTHGTHFLNAYLTLDNSNDNNYDATSNVVSTSVNQNKQLSFPKGHSTSNFLVGTIGGVANQVVDSTGGPDGRIAGFTADFYANDTFYMVYDHQDGFRVFGADYIGISNPFFVSDGASSNKIKVTSARNISFYVNTDDQLCDIDLGYSVSYTNNSNVVVSDVPLYCIGTDSSDKPQFSADISPKDGSTLSFKLGDTSISPSKEDGANVDGSLRVYVGGPKIGVYLKEQGNNNYTLWATFPTIDVYVDGSLYPVESRNNTHGNSAIFDVPLNKGQKVTVFRGYTQLHFGINDAVEYTASNSSTYAFYVNGEFKVYYEELATVTFSVHKETGIEYSVFAVGNFSGDYEPWLEYKLSWTEGNIWTGTLLLPLGKQLKLCLSYTDNPSKINEGWAWESGDALTITHDMSVNEWRS